MLAATWAQNSPPRYGFKQSQEYYALLRRQIEPKAFCVVLRSMGLLCRVDELHAGRIVGFLCKRRRINGHEHFDRRIGNKLKNVTADRTSIWLAEHRVHMDYGYAIKSRDVPDERQALDLLRDRDAAVHFLRNV